jgi:hypothetical protein
MEGRAGVSIFPLFSQFALANSWSVHSILAIRNGSFLQSSFVLGKRETLRLSTKTAWRCTETSGECGI